MGCRDQEELEEYLKVCTCRTSSVRRCLARYDFADIWVCNDQTKLFVPVPPFLAVGPPAVPVPPPTSPAQPLRLFPASGPVRRVDPAGMAGGSAPSIVGLCGLVVFGWTVDSVLRSSLAADAARDLDVVELFSGVGAVHRAAQSLGLRSAVFDKFRVPGVTDKPSGSGSEDMAEEAGFLSALGLVLRHVVITDTY